MVSSTIFFPRRFDGGTSRSTRLSLCAQDVPPSSSVVRFVRFRGAFVVFRYLYRSNPENPIQLP